MDVFRVERRTRAEDLTGEGARLHSGRWNSKGNLMLYTSDSPSLALLEVLAHSTILPADRVLLTLRLPPRIRIPQLTLNELPVGWNTLPHTVESQRVGDAFLSAGKFLALRVPSVIIPRQENIVINPLHPYASRIAIISIDEIEFDSRLKV